MTLSLNEIEGTAKKATRGAGYPWGLAEEAGKATRWLCSRNLDGCAALAGLLERTDGMDIAGWSPEPGGKVWVAAEGVLCPLATGAAISDRGQEILTTGILLDAMVQPILLAPFAAMLAQQAQRTVTLDWDGGGLSTDGGQISLNGSLPDATPWARISIGGQVGASNSRRNRGRPGPGAWDMLNRFANRTYAPATEDSRLRGAGAGLSDND